MIGHRRRELGLTINALASACHLPSTYMQQIEQGQVTPGIKVLAVIGKVLGIRLY